MNAEISTDFVPNHAHNLLLNTALCIGFPGAALLLMNILSMLWRMISWAGAVVCIATTFVIVAGITEPVLYGPMPRSHTVLWLMALFWQCAGGPKLSSGTAVGRWQYEFTAEYHCRRKRDRTANAPHFQII